MVGSFKLGRTHTHTNVLIYKQTTNGLTSRVLRVFGKYDDRLFDIARSLVRVYTEQGKLVYLVLTVISEVI